MSENYLTTIEPLLREMFANVADGTNTVDDAVRFLKEELLASYKRGRETALRPRKTASPKTRRSHRPAYRK